VTAEDQKLSDWFPSQVPIWLDAGYLVTPNLLVGLYGQYGFLTVANDCDHSEICSAHEIRFGVQGQYHLAPTRTIDPWLGAGFGYELVSLHNRQGGNREDVGFNGWEFLNLQAGVDFEVARPFSLGPFLSVSFDRFSHAKFNDQSYDIPDKAWHEWITLGVKGTFGL
jgi:outer membrane protein W